MAMAPTRFWRRSAATSGHGFIRHRPSSLLASCRPSFWPITAMPTDCVPPVIDKCNAITLYLATRQRAHRAAPHMSGRRNGAPRAMNKLLLAVMILVAAVDPVTAEEHMAQAGDIKVVHAWARATDAEEGAVFMDIESLGGAGDGLTGATSDAAERVELHGTRLQDGTMTSQRLEAIDIPAGGEFVLEPGAVFLKLLGLRQALVQGQEFEVELAFARAGTLGVHVLVEAADATQHSHAGHVH